MSQIESKTSTEMVIPTIESKIFEGHESSQLAVGIVAVGSNVLADLDEEYRAYLLLRGNVYAKEKNYMPESELKPDGTETDADDIHSIHLAVIENAIRNARVVGSMRLIIKEREDRPLPIEQHYPEAFMGIPAPVNSMEASRLISRHEDRKIQKAIKWLLFAAATEQIQAQGQAVAYGAVEESLANSFQREGMETEKLAEPKYVEEFNAVKLPLLIDIDDLSGKLRLVQPDLMRDMPILGKGFVYTGTVPEKQSAEVAVA